MSTFKKPSILAVFCIIIITFQSVQAWNNVDDPPVIPYKTSPSILFGKDIVINDIPNQNQKNLSICSAPNGWLYAIYSIDSLNNPWFKVLRSKDNGYSWNFLGEHTIEAPDVRSIRLEAVAVGIDSSDQKLFVAEILHYVPTGEKCMQLYRFNCDPFTFEKTLISSSIFFGFHDMAIAVDYTFPALLSSPFSMGVLLSEGTLTTEELVLFLSGDGRQNITQHRQIAVSNKKIRNVALAYGRSSYQNYGRYFATWEEDADTSAAHGHIYTSHSDPDFNSPFTTPIQLDGLDPSLTNLCRNPVIACQVNDIDNDSANLSEVVLFEKFNPGSGDYDIAGFYNKKGATGKTFTRLNVASTSNNELQPDIVFNPFDSTFIVTYYDSTNQKLPLLKNNLNLVNPGSWDVVSPGYNESFKLSNPNPKVRLNMALQKPINGWIGTRPSGNGVALFDASYFPPTGIGEQNQPDLVHLYGAYPNPCNTPVTISFDLKKTEKVVISLHNLVGQSVATITNQIYQPGKNSVTYDVSGLPAGSYYYTLKAGSYSKSGKICVVR
ncbi:MAG: T9SS type A sorting domain-containing protein [Bacteroidales bacterium]|nr:T9SS type A sorting domain-containing protein [Bacteroidales bacterium]